MYGIAQTHESIDHPHTIRILNNFQGFTKKSLRKNGRKPVDITKQTTMVSHIKRFYRGSKPF